MKTTNYLLAGMLLLLTFTNCSKDSNSLQAGIGAGGSTARFTILGNYLYVVDHSSLKTFLVSDPEHPVYKSKTAIGINIETIFPYQDKLFIGSSSSMFIYSVAQPEKPVQIGRADYTIRMACDPVVVKDSVAYATLRGGSRCGGTQSALVVYNIKNINSPKLETTYSLMEPYGLGLKEDALYVCEGTAGLKIFNITNAYQPVPVGAITNRIFYDVIPYGNILIGQTANGFVLYDISTPLTPVFLGEIS